MSFTVNVLSAKAILPTTHRATWDNENEADASMHRIWKTVKGIAFSLEEVWKTVSATMFFSGCMSNN